MKNVLKWIMKYLVGVVACVCMLGLLVSLAGCSDVKTTASGGTKADTAAQSKIADTLATNQSTPTDLNYSLERYNLIKRAYWVNGQREKANALVCAIEKPLGYIVLFSGNTTVGRFVVDGKVTSLNSFLTPSNVDQRITAYSESIITVETADVDGSYGENDKGIFFFTPDGRYIEWNGGYLYSDIPFEVDDPIIKYEVKE